MCSLCLSVYCVLSASSLSLFTQLFILTFMCMSVPVTNISYCFSAESGSHSSAEWIACYTNKQAWANIIKLSVSSAVTAQHTWSGLLMCHRIAEDKPLQDWVMIERMHHGHGFLSSLSFQYLCQYFRLLISAGPRQFPRDQCNLEWLLKMGVP